jgi:hypothetical protein
MNMKPTRIQSIDPYDWTEILVASQSEGYNMVKRLVSDFRAGCNRFDAPDEFVLAQVTAENRGCAPSGPLPRTATT